MNFLTLLEATIKLGIPMVVLSWIIFTWLYGGGDLDRKSDRKSINAQVKKMKKSFREKRKDGAANYMVDKWMWFGSGFYGLAGLWTFAVIEIMDILRIIANPSRILAAFEDGLVSAAIDLLTNQFSNLVSAFVWFGYWSNDGVLLWVLLAYGGYWLGVEMARRGEELPIRDMLRKLRALLPNRQE